MISVLGSINLDQIASAHRLPAPGETTLAQSFMTAPGGKGANQALAAQRAGADVRLVGAVGRDLFAAPALALLHADGVDLSHVRAIDAPTGLALIVTDAAGENIIVVVPGANAALDKRDVDAALDGLAPGDHLLLQQEIPEAIIARALERAKAAGIVSILNVAPFLELSRALVRLASILIANEGEFAQLSGQSGAPAIAAWAKAHHQILIVTHGAAGAIAASPKALFHAPALDITPIDTIGAGDAFCGYLAAGLDAHLSLEQATRRAAIAASLACLNRGAQSAAPHAHQVDAQRAG